MREFLLKISFWILQVMVIAYLVRLVTPFYAGNIDFKDKYEHAKMQYAEVLLMGSSRFYRHINPSYLSKKVGKNFYNLGTSGCSAPESLFLMRGMLSDSELTANTIIFELSNWVTLEHEQENVFRKTNIYDWDIALSEFKISQSRKNGSEQKEKLIPPLFKACVRRILGLAGLRNQLSFLMQETMSINVSNCYNYGFRPLYGNKSQGEIRSALYRANKGKKPILSNFSEEETITYEEYYSIIKEIQSLADKRNLNIIYVIPPLEARYSDLKVLAGKIKYEMKKIVVDLSSPTDLPDLYNEENIWDRAHFNENGAQIITDYLYQQLEHEI